MRRIEDLIGAALLAAAALLMPLAAFVPVQPSHASKAPTVASACGTAVSALCDRARG